LVLTESGEQDDGTPIEVTVAINATDGSARIDFSGTGPEVFGARSDPFWSAGC
jgi:5-oxoprolinase (ATP-hydrolysing)